MNTYYMFKKSSKLSVEQLLRIETCSEDVKNDVSSFFGRNDSTKIGLEVDNLNKKISAKVDQTKFNQYVGENGEIITGINDKVNDVQIGLDGINTKVSEVQCLLAQES